MRNKAIAKQRQSGFTLIELMIVVAIVGILASVAVPAYSDYTVRAKVTEAVSAVAPVKASIADYYYSNGSLPGSSDDAGLDGSPSGIDSVVGGSYATDVIQSISVGSDPSNGTITVSLQELGSGVSSGDTLVFIPNVGSNGQITWDCDAAQGDGTLADRYAPANCRGDDSAT